MLVRWIVRLAPIGVFALMMPLGAHGGAGLVGAIGFYILAYSLASVLFVLLLYPLLALVARVPMRDFARAALPAQLIAFSSSSSIAALPALVRGAESSVMTREVADFMVGVGAGNSGTVSLVEIPEGHHHLMFDQPFALLVAIRALLAGWECSTPLFAQAGAA